MTVRVTVWSENHHERHDPPVAALYLDGIHGTIAAALAGDSAFAVRTATQDQPEQGLGGGLLDETDVLLWWGHRVQDEVDDAHAETVRRRVSEGMGLVALHSALNSKPFRAVVGTTGRSFGFRHGGRELVWTATAGHPIVHGIPNPVIVPDSEMYCEPFDVGQVDETVFISGFDGGEVFRSGLSFRRGRGKVFYFGPGHEEYPIYHDPTIQQILRNAVHWVTPDAPPTLVVPSAPRDRDKPVGWFAGGGVR
ncbi:MAG TPA: ThuA domain-containing protein [Microlunatus sp.]